MEKSNSYDHLSLKDIFQGLAKSNDRSLYNHFFNKYYPKLIWFTLLYVKQHNAAEEVVSDVFLTILRNREKICKMDSIEGYLFIITKNQALKYLRRKRPVVYMDKLESEEDLIISGASSPEDVYIGNEFYWLIKQTIDALPAKRKMVFKLIKEDQLKYKDVAELLDLSIKTVEAHMGLALKTVSKAISDYKNNDSLATRVIPLKNKKSN
ncbi:MAG: RNA polymerase sigma-70 factor [Cyclobacteriaceae bacterium]